MKVKFDSTTRKWFTKHPLAETTVTQCEECGLFYKPMLGHNCCYIPRHNSKSTQANNIIIKEILKESS